MKTITPKELVAKAKAKGVALTIEEAEKKIAQANAHNTKEAGIIKKYGKGSGFKNRKGELAEVDIIPGTLTNGEKVPLFKDDGVTPKFAKKMVVQIKCAHEGCKEKRYVATSDLHNVRYCEEHQKEFKAKGKSRSKRTSASDNLEAAEFLNELLG